MAHIKFYLRPTAENTVGTLCHWLIEGKKIIQRKSYGTKLPFKFWDTKHGKLKRGHPDHIRINKIIDEVINSFDYQASLGGNGNIEDQCVLMLFQREIDNKMNSGLSSGSYKKYSTILKNFKNIANLIYGSEKIPIRYFREIETINNIKSELLKSRKNDCSKSFKAVKNYMGRLAEVVNQWNATSGTQHPINTVPFTKNIGKDDQKIARAFTEEELKLFIDYTPTGYRGGWVELVAKSFFMFQYWCGGTRIHDILLLTNKSVLGEQLEVRIRKNNTVVHNPITFELAKTLEPIYPEIFQIVYEETRMHKVKIKFNSVKDLAKLQHPDTLPTWNLKQLDQIMLKVKHEFPNEFESIRPSFDDAREKLEQIVGERFFEELSLRQEHFIYPYLDIKDFEGTGLNWRKFNKEMEDKIQRVRAKHNNALKRICSKLGIEGATGHTPRHTVVRHMLMLGAEDNVIKDVLGHSHLNTTQHYLQSRHPLRGRGEELKKMYRGLKNNPTEQ
jgi:integrase